MNYLAPLKIDTIVRKAVEPKVNLSASRSIGMYKDPDEAMDNIKLGTKDCIKSFAKFLCNLNGTVRTDTFPN